MFAVKFFFLEDQLFINDQSDVKQYIQTCISRQ